MRRKSS